MNIIGILLVVLVTSVPLIIALSGGLLIEKCGIMNLSIEGTILFGSFFSYFFALLSNNLLIGILGGILGGALFGLLFGIFVAYFNTNQTVTAVGMNFIALGITGTMWSSLSTNGAMTTFGQTHEFTNLGIKKVQDLATFSLGNKEIRINIYVILCVILVGSIYFLLNKTKKGLVIKALGENPMVVKNNFMDVRKLRLIIVIIGSGIIGFGSSYLTLYELGSFNNGISAGKGYIIFICIIFGRFKLSLGILGIYIFSFGEYLSRVLQLGNSSLLNHLGGENFALMLPYILILIVLIYSRKSYTPKNWSLPFDEE